MAIITPDRYYETFEFMANHFTPDDPIDRAFGITWNKDYEKQTLEDLKNNISICVISKDTDEIMGVRITGIMKKADPPQDLSNIENEPYRNMMTFLTHKDKEVNIFERYKVDEVIHFSSLGVNKKYRCKGIGGRLIAVSVAMSRELGFKVIKGECTSNFSQRIYEKQGFDIVLEMPYASYFYNGRPLIERTREHTMTKVYALKF